MAFELRIKNIGKITDANLHIGKFTVFAGPNSTGKSYVSKLLYSLFDGMNSNYTLEHFLHLIDPLRQVLGKPGLYDENEHWDFNLADKHFQKTVDWEGMFRSCAPNDFNRVREILSDVNRSIREWKQIYGSYYDSITSKPKENSTRPPGYIHEQFLEIQEILDRLQKRISCVQEVSLDTNLASFITEGIDIVVVRNIIRNFQVPDLSRIMKVKGESAKISIEGIGKFELDKNLASFHITGSGLQQLREYSRVIYLESPIYWKLKSALENLQLAPRYSEIRDRERISGVPGYFYDLARALKEEYSGDVAFPEQYERITKQTIGGKITISDTGDLIFQENDKSFSLHLTAMGVVNLGILALLVERKIIDKGSFLFIDEPEAHLHPAWQVKIAEVLLELSRLGVNVVIATHSATILKFIEVAVNKNPEYEKLIALNHFSAEGVKNGEEDFDIKMANIKQELTKPFADLYMEGLL